MKKRHGSSGNTKNRLMNVKLGHRESLYSFGNGMTWFGYQHIYSLVVHFETLTT